MSAVPPEQTFDLLVPVLPGDVDELGHVNNTVYLRWAQDVATAHWQSLASVESQAAILWVVVRHEIDYKAPALPGDGVLLRTWVGKATRITFERHTLIVHATRNQLLAQARTLWCPTSKKTGKPHRVSGEVRAQFST
ncbi:MAG TPA: thioesterase family protein [Chthoniobacterales bacterium]|nr:thioesterase family protein [Chthoniobacterales bacterium]